MSPDEEILPEDPISQYQAWAAEVHECHTTLVDVGFTPEQSFAILLRGVSRGWFDSIDDDADA